MKIYKHIRKVFSAAIIISIVMGMISCTDVQGDGIYTVTWEGSELPEDSCYRNPVWEPDLSFPSVFKAAVGYYAIGADKEWTPGLTNTAPVLSSNDVMNWRFRGEAFQEKPDWSDGMITEISAGFAKTKGTYYVFYALDGAGIGMGASKAPQGPYTDFGLLINADFLGLAECANPFFFTFGSKAYLFFQGGDGIYGQEVLLNKTELAELKGDIFKVTGAAISSINMIKLNDYYYLFAGVEDGNNSRVNLGRATDVKGPYLDSNGNDLLNGEGTPLLASSLENGFVAVNHIGGVFEDADDEIWVLYQATDIDRPSLSSGADRHPLMLNRIELDESGWPAMVIDAKGGWNHPKFIK